MNYDIWGLPIILSGDREVSDISLKREDGRRKNFQDAKLAP
jgi:hypothetical protein